MGYLCLQLPCVPPPGFQAPGSLAHLTYPSGSTEPCSGCPSPAEGLGSCFWLCGSLARLGQSLLFSP